MTIQLWTTRVLSSLDSYLKILVKVFTNHISAENHISRTISRVIRAQDHFFKLASKNQIILLFHDFISFFINCFHSFIYFFIKPEFYKHHFNRVENSKWQRQDISFKHLLFTVWFTVARKLFCKIMQHMFLRKSDLPRDLSCGLSFWGITVMFQTK